MLVWLPVCWNKKLRKAHCLSSVRLLFLLHCLSHNHPETSSACAVILCIAGASAWTVLVILSMVFLARGYKCAVRPGHWLLTSHEFRMRNLPLRRIRNCAMHVLFMCSKCCCGPVLLQRPQVVPQAASCHANIG